MSYAANRILIVLFGAIGDVTRALPLLCRLRRGYPGTRVLWAIEPLAAPLLDGHAALDERIVFARERGVRGFAAFLRKVRRQRVDLVLDLGRQFKSGVTAFATGAPVRIGFNRRNSREGNWCFQTETIEPQEHYSSKLQQYWKFGDHLGIPEIPIEFGLDPSSAEREGATVLLAGVRRPFAAFVLGSSCPSRRWFPERTAAVANALWSRHGYTAVLLGTAADRAFGSVVRETLVAPVRDLVGATSLRDLLVVLGEAAVAVTPDSGAMHMAAARGVPVVSLWGATSAARSAPHGSADLTLIGDASCAPCYLKECRIGRVCMQAIQPADVISRVEVAVERSRHRAL